MKVLLSGEGILNYNSIIDVISGFISIVGTIYAILSLLRMKPADIWNTCTFGGISNRDLEILEQRRQARTGILLVIYGWSIQVVLLFIDIRTFLEFSNTVAVIVLIGILICLLMGESNNRFEENYKREKRKKEQQMKYS